MSTDAERVEPSHIHGGNAKLYHHCKKPAFPQKVKHGTSTAWYTSKRDEGITYTQKHVNVHRSIMHNIWKMETIQISIK